MNRQLQRLTLAITCAGMIGFTADRASSSGGLGGVLGTVLKGGGIIVAVRMFGNEINKTINTLLLQKGLAYEGATKVVPIISVGSGKEVGAAQVQGAKSMVDDVRGVGQIEAQLGDLSGQLLVPLNTLTPTKGIEKVKGVGVSSIIDFRI